MKRTTNYSLPTWEKSDFIQMSDFNDLTHKLDSALKGHDDTLNTKADASSVTAVQQEVAAASAASAERVTALAQDVGAGGKNCRIAWGSYTGTGKYGSANPNTLTFDFKPLVVWVGSDSSGKGTAFPATFMRPVITSRSDSSTPDHQLNVTWGEKQLSWYASSYTTIYAGNQCNAENVTYFYVAIGW